MLRAVSLALQSLLTLTALLLFLCAARAYKAADATLLRVQSRLQAEVALGTLVCVGNTAIVAPYQPLMLTVPLATP
jgi:hypothetical protein